ncbi:TMEM175 family protein [Aquirhabdus parva]|uniref:DUF1211 domain-containing protein n=1 Tax=Aquirhabdus parva TaxID=2283318 RepID=A0A345P8R6_9GAMM|nr:TMEM175 family protein [Aquirhabdus parva]AXI03675.1 DUF1211 domain-containing protein [Aquirhabdus parva]
MNTNRLEAFSDGVIAIIITIMVLEIKVPHGETLEALAPLIPVLLSYVLSFIYVGIYWNNHHHFMHMVHNVNGKILWANLHLLFWLSLIPFATGWIGENHISAVPVALYGFILMMCGIAYTLLARIVISVHGQDPKLAAAIGRDYKGIVSVIAYLSAIPLAFVNPWISIALYVAVAILWFLPDRRIERVLD